MSQPSPNGDNGDRDTSGRFTKGNAGGPGTPYARRVAALRLAMMDSVTEEDMRAIIATLITMAKDGDTRAIKEIFDRTLGKPIEADVIARLEELEARVVASTP